METSTLEEQLISPLKIPQPSQKKTLLAKSDTFVELKKNHKQCDTDIVLKINPKEIEKLVKSWVFKHSETVDEAVGRAVVGATLGGSFQFLTANFFRSILPGPMSLGVLSGPRSATVRNIAVMAGVHTGLMSVMRRLRGKDDFQTGMVSGFGAGFMGGLSCGMRGPDAFSHGVIYALLMGAAFELKDHYSQKQAEDVLYNETRGMLSSLDLNRYEHNFKMGKITDRSLPFLSDSDLKEVDIPVGARRVILDHIQREKEVKINNGF